MTFDMHGIFIKETSFGTWLTPTFAIPLRSFNLNTNQENIEGRDTGATRALKYLWDGSIAPGGSVESRWWSEYMGLFMMAGGLHLVTSWQDVGQTLSYDHSFLPNDTVALPGLSAQGKYSSAVAMNMLGACLNSWEISGEVKGNTMFSADILALDIARTGGNWSDGSGAPAVIATPAYFSGALEPFFARQIIAEIGGTVSEDPTSKQLSAAGATATTRIESFRISVNNNLEYVHSMNAQENPAFVHAGERSVEFSMSLNWQDLDTQWWDRLRAGTEFALSLVAEGSVIEGAFNYKLAAMLPACKVSEGDYPEITGDYSRPVLDVSGTAKEHAGTGRDLNVVVRDTQATY